MTTPTTTPTSVLAPVTPGQVLYHDKTCQCNKEKFGDEKIFFLVHQENISVKFIPSLNPTFYSKTGVCRGIPILLIFAPKHRLWVLIRTASGSNVYPQPLSRNKENINIFPLKFPFVCYFEKLCILHGHCIRNK